MIEIAVSSLSVDNYFKWIFAECFCTSSLGSIHPVQRGAELSQCRGLLLLCCWPDKMRGCDGFKMPHGAGEAWRPPTEDVCGYVCGNADFSVGATDWDRSIVLEVVGCRSASSRGRYNSNECNQNTVFREDISGGEGRVV